jgi:hypothetical protein
MVRASSNHLQAHMQHDLFLVGESSSASPAGVRYSHSPPPQCGAAACLLHRAAVFIESFASSWAACFSSSGVSCVRSRRPKTALVLTEHYSKSPPRAYSSILGLWRLTLCIYTHSFTVRLVYHCTILLAGTSCALGNYLGTPAALPNIFQSSSLALEIVLCLSFMQEQFPLLPFD